MNHKLKEIDGKVRFLLRAGKDFVKNEMTIASAQHIIDTGKIKQSDVDGYPINVNDTWYFDGEKIQERVSKKQEIEEQ